MSSDEMVLLLLHILARMELDAEVVVVTTGPHTTLCRQGRGSTMMP